MLATVKPHGMVLRARQPTEPRVEIRLCSSHLDPRETERLAVARARLHGISGIVLGHIRPPINVWHALRPTLQRVRCFNYYVLVSVHHIQIHQALDFQKDILPQRNDSDAGAELREEATIIAS